MQYRIYWKNKDGGRYATKAEYLDIYIKQAGTVWWLLYDEMFDITDQVIVEYETFVKDTKGKLLFEGDKFVLANSREPVEEYIIRRNTDGRLMSVYPSNNAFSIPLSCCCVDLMIVIGTVHDESNKPV